MDRSKIAKALMCISSYQQKNELLLGTESWPQKKGGPKRSKQSRQKADTKKLINAYFIVSYYIKWVITSWSYSIGNKNKFNLLVLLEGATWALVVTHVARVHDARVLGVDVVLQPCRSVHTTRTFKFTHNGVYWNILTQKDEVCPVYDAISQLPFSQFFF